MIKEAKGFVEAVQGEIEYAKDVNPADYVTSLANSLVEQTKDDIARAYNRGKGIDEIQNYLDLAFTLTTVLIALGEELAAEKYNVLLEEKIIEIDSLKD